MAHGGVRPGSGRKPGWKSGPTKAVKLPVVLVDEILAFAYALDSVDETLSFAQVVEAGELVTDSNGLDDDDLHDLRLLLGLLVELGGDARLSKMRRDRVHYADKRLRAFLEKVT